MCERSERAKGLLGEEPDGRVGAMMKGANEANVRKALWKKSKKGGARMRDANEANVRKAP